MTCWFPVAGWQGLYEITTDGRVRSLTRKVMTRLGHMQTFHSTELKQLIGERGYPYVALSDVAGGRGRHKNECVHRLVAKTFLPNPLQLPEVNHKDGNKLNPRVENLEWVTPGGNRKHAWATGLLPIPSGVGELNPNAVLDESMVRGIRNARSSGMTHVEVARRFGISTAHAKAVALGRSWKHVTDPPSATNVKRRKPTSSQLPAPPGGGK